MDPLYLSGFGVSLSVDRARLIARDGFVEPDSNRITHELQPRDARYDSVVIDGHSQYNTGCGQMVDAPWLANLHSGL